MTTIVDGTTGITFPSTISGVSATQQYSGRVLQVVQATTTSTTTTTSNSFVDTNLSASITPTSSSSKIFVLMSSVIYFTRGSSQTGAKMQLVRGSTNLITQTDSSLFGSGNGLTGIEVIQQPIIQYLDSPATTSSTTYKIQFAVNTSTTGYFSWNGNSSYLTLMEIAA